MTTNHVTVRHRGTALVVSGPSGAGKTSVCRRLLELQPGLHFSVSCTTRPRRADEMEGRDYYFKSRNEFEELVQNEAFLEFAEVHGNMYGTLRSEVEEYVSSGQGVLLDIDVQGARQIRSRIIDTSLGYATEFVFIGPPSYSEMERRLRSRGTDREDVIERRLKNAYNELDAWNEYDFLVINEDVQTAAEQLQAILKATTCTTSRILGNPWPDLERAL